MEIKELQAGQGSVNIEATVKSMEEPRTINKYGKDLRLANAIIADSSGEMKLTLWNEDVDKVKTGSIVKITNGYVTEFQGEKQITAGKFGKLEIVGEGDAPTTEAAPATETPTEAPSTDIPTEVPAETPSEAPTEETTTEEVVDY